MVAGLSLQTSYFGPRGVWHDTTVGDLCDTIVLGTWPPTLPEGCWQYRPRVTFRQRSRNRKRRNVTHEDWEIRSSASTVQHAVLFHLTRFYHVAGVSLVPQQPGTGTPLSRLVRSPWEGLQVWSDSAYGLATDVVFAIRRDFVTFPLWHPAQRAANGGRPDIYMIILDSVSRRVLRHFAPSVASFFHQDLPHHQAFSFESFHTICGGGTASTLYPMFHGGIGVQSAPSWCSEGLPDTLPWTLNYSAVAACFNDSRRILKLGKESGFVVGLSANWFLPLHNDQSDVHHATNAVMCPMVCDKLSMDECIDNYNMVGNMARCTDLYCMGKERYGKKLLSWNYDFFKTYADRPKLLASMLQGAHRVGGDLHVLQEDLWVHLDGVLRSEHSPFRDSAVFLMGDHGHKSVACDYTSPFLGVFVPRSLRATSMGEAATRAISRNAELSQDGMLVTPWDLYATLRHLIDWGSAGDSKDYFGMHELSATQEIQSHVDNGTRFLRHFEQASLLQETEAYGRFSLAGPFLPKSLFVDMPATRGCEEAGVAAGHCVADMVPVAHFTCHHEVTRRQKDQLQSTRRIDATATLPQAFEDGTVMGMLTSTFPQVFNDDVNQTELLLALLDSDSDGRFQTEELLPVVEAAGDDGPNASDYEQQKAFWCAAGVSRLEQIIHTMNIAYTQGSHGLCQRFTLMLLDRIVVSKGIHGMSLACSFTVGQGDPPSRYETTLTGKLSPAPRRTWWSPGSLYAATRYHKYQACTPKGFVAEFCVCEQRRLKLD